MMTPSHRKIADMNAKISKVFVPTARTQQVESIFGELIAESRDRSGDHSSVLIVGPSQSGKTTSIVKATEKLESTLPGQVPILHVTLPADVTRKSMIECIFTAAANRGFHNFNKLSGNEYRYQQRAFTLLENLDTLLLILDECHHIRGARDAVRAVQVGELVKTFLIEGPCPLVLAGVGEAAKNPYQTNEQLMLRSRPFVELAPLQLTNPADRALFGKMFTEFFDELERLQIAENVREFQKAEFKSCLFQAADGVVGQAIRLVREAFRQMIIAERAVLRISDFETASDGILLTSEKQRINHFSKLSASGFTQ
ncbi:ATP-binding protein [Maricaulis sp.]|uniref:ATP-binding protein n=1 Tax=Maricaulis sp. TaxID=1486257 RepID=UPI003A955914